MENQQKKKIMSQEHANVLSIIMHSDKKYITNKQILLRLQKDYSYTRQLKAIINDLILIYRYPIGSSSNEGTRGYFYIRDQKDYELAKKTLVTRLNGINERIIGLEQAYKGEFKDVI